MPNNTLLDQLELSPVDEQKKQIKEFNNAFKN
jgi:hypothetical protein